MRPPRPDLANADEIIPYDGTPYIGNTSEEDSLAELQIRRLANRHGHTRLPRRGGGWVEICPDLEAHARDVAAMAVALEACGFVPYMPGKPRQPPEGCKKTVTNYRRPGR